jgi:hypothetical protein
MGKRTFFIFTAMIFAVTSVFAQQGTLKDITGTVEVKKSGQANFVPAKSGDAVDKSTAISTGFKSTVTVVMGNSSIFVRPLTRLTLDELIQGQGSEKVSVSLQTGRVKVDVKPPAGGKTDFTVKAPSATASVRGTAFDFDAYSLSVTEGTVAYSGRKGKPMLVSAGNTSRIDQTKDGRGGRSADPVEIADSELIPPSPAGADSAAIAKNSAPAPVIQSSSPSANLGLAFDWDH